eukprot:TRINITY_DN79371_c0_g1_i1.p1 TRINITY_DN79371_c0_g1~~TRINITY_DN79371_c0_g1_i1.p1  ORF type:complete len:347 (-),score=79.70 TRINITY_DN79371_c0_g1_i1:113-1153(-)
MEVKQQRKVPSQLMQVSNELMKTAPPLSPQSAKSAASSMPVLSPARSASAPNLPELKQPLETIYGKRWTTETKLYLHRRRERRWLALKQKDRFVDFSVKERAQLRRYFDALAGSSGRVCLEQLENMLISLGLAENQRDVGNLISRIDDLKIGELDFEQFLELLCARTDRSQVIKIFKEMADGNLGDRNLNFQTVISEYRRQHFMDASGASGAPVHRQESGSKVLQNFAALQRSRWDALHPPEDEEAAAMGASMEPSKEPNFKTGGQAPMGGMEVCWRGVCCEHNLLSEPVDGRSRRTVEKPKSPREIVESILKSKPKPQKKFAGRVGTIIVPAPALDAEEYGARRG